MKEIWKDIINYEGLYKISTYGNVLSLKKKEQVILKPAKNMKGYLFVCLCKNKIKKRYLIARLVLLNFLPRKNSSILQVNHLDGNKTNNCVYNLAWCTSSENIAHAYKVGLKDYKGENNPFAKLSNENVLEIRSLLKQNMPQKNIAQKYKVSRSVISDIKRGRLWKHI